MKQPFQKFNNLIKNTIFKVQNKTNNKFQISNFIQKFNNLIKDTIFKVQNKTNNKFQISNFNKYLIIFIASLFSYLFYLSIPVLYNKSWVQRNIEDQLFKEFKINFSISSNISYRILPAPHFLIKDSKIFKQTNEKTVSLADIKELKVFISQRNLFNKKKIIVKFIKIDNANFSLSRDDLKLLRNNTNNKHSKKIIEINGGNVFLKDNLDVTIAIIKISKAISFFDNENLSNKFDLKGKVFNVPFSLKYRKEFNSFKSEKINIIAKTLKLNIIDIYKENETNLNFGKNIISFLNHSINTSYNIKDGVVTFNSFNSKIKNNKVVYDGRLSINPFDLNLNINLDDYGLLKLLDINSILNELIKTELLFNNNISINTLIKTTASTKKEIFQDVNINFNIVNGKINFNKTRLINKKIGLLELNNSNLRFENDRLILNTDIMFEINNSNELFSLLQTNKRSRKQIKNILINLDYDFLTNQIEFNNFKIDDKNLNDKLLVIVEGFKDNNSNNWNKSRRLLNILFDAYEG